MKKYMKNISKKIISFIIAVAMCITMIVPSAVTVMAAPSIKHSVTLEQSGGGTIVFKGTNKIKTGFREGDTVEVSLDADDGYDSSKISVVYNSDNEVAASDDAIGKTTYSFDMPNEAVTVTVDWVKVTDSEDGSYKVIESSDNSNDSVLEVIADSDVEETVSEDTESFSVDSDYFGDIKEITDDVDVSNEDVADAESDVLLEQYIAENADIDYIGEGDLMLANAILAKQTLFNGEYIKSNDTIDSVMNVIEQAGVISDALLEDAYNKFMYQTESYVSVYATSIDADYYVALADVLIDNDNFTAREAVFAENNNNGVVLDGCIFDKDTGLVYIPKDCFFRDEETYEIAGIQVQLMQIMKPGGDKVEITTEVTSGDEFFSAYTTETTIYDTETQVYTETGLEESNMEVSVNGVVYEDDAYCYDADTGLIELNVAPTSVQTVAIEIVETTIAESMSNVLGKVWDTLTGTVTAYAANAIYDSWQYFYSDAIKPGQLVDGASIDGTAGVQYVHEYEGRGQDVYAYDDAINGSVEAWSQFAHDLFNNINIASVKMVNLGDSNDAWTTFNVYLNMGVDATVDGTFYRPLNYYVPGFSSISRAVVLKCTHVSSGIDAPFGGSDGNNIILTYGVISESVPVHIHCYYMGQDGDNNYAIIGMVTHFVDDQAGAGLIKVMVGDNYPDPEESTPYYEARQAQPQQLDVYVAKYDEKTGEPVEGATFEYYCDDMETPVGTAVTNSDGIACYHWNGDVLYTDYFKSSDSGESYKYCSNYEAIDPDLQSNYYDKSAPYNNRAAAYDAAKSWVVKQCNDQLADFTTKESSKYVQHNWKVVETKAPDGYYIADPNSWSGPVDLNTTAIEIEYDDPPQGWLAVRKESANPDLDSEDAAYTTSNSCYSCVGAEYGIYTSYEDALNAHFDDKNDNRIYTLTTESENGQGDTYAIDSTDIETGTYYIRETKHSPGYYLCDGSCDDADSNGIHTVTVYKNEITEFTCKEIPMNDPLGITMYKIDRDLERFTDEGIASLEGAEFTINFYAGDYSESEIASMTPTRSWTIKTVYNDGQYVASPFISDCFVSGDDWYYTLGGAITFPLGTYTIEETKAADDYLIEGHFYEGVYDGNLDDNNYLCDAGQVFYTQLLEDSTEDDGIWMYGGNNYYTESDEVQRGDFVIAKWDKELVDFNYDHVNMPQGDADLKDAVFEIVSLNDNPVVVPDIPEGGQEYQYGEVVMTLNTYWDPNWPCANGTTGQYIATTKIDGATHGSLPVGHYLVRERDPDGAPEGYLHTGILEREFDITYDGEYVDYTASEDSIQNYPMRGGFEIQKRDSQTALAYPQGDASWANITLAIENESDCCVLVDVNNNGEFDYPEEEFEPGEVIMTFQTDDTGYYKSKDDLLPYGSYRIYEVNIPLDDGYLYGSGDFIDSYPYIWGYETDHRTMLADSNVVCDFNIRADGQIANVTGVDDEYGESQVELTPTNDPDGSIYDTSESEDYDKMVAPGYALEDTVKRGDLAIRKQNEETQSTPDGPIEWKLTSTTTGETHYFWTDSNGDYSTDSTWRPHTYLTNAGEDETDGIWFYGYETDINGDPVAEYGTSDVGYDESHLEVVDNALGALPYDHYTLDELRGENNQGRRLIHTDFTIYQDMRTVDLGTLDNPIQAIETTSYNARTNDKWIDSTENAHIRDVIEYWNLVPGRDYTFVTELYDITTGEFISINPDSDEEYAIVTSFDPKHEDGETEVNIYFDATELAGHTLIVLEYAYEYDELICQDAEITNEKQMVYLPLVGTELLDEYSDHEHLADNTVTFVDTVSYENMPTDTWITMTGTLYDDNTGDVIYDANGNKVTAETTWYNEEPDGVVEVTFTFDASLLAGHTIVAGETAYVNNLAIGHHFDYDDEAQLLTFPYVETDLINDWTGEKAATIFENHDISLTDTVTYENLIPGETYTLVGVLIDKETGEYALNHEGEDVWAEVEFTPDEPDGSIEVNFTFDANGMHGTDVVAYEYLYTEDAELVAIHADMEDENQTMELKLPTVWTYAAEMVSGLKSITPTDDVIVVDMLDCTNLIPGHTYYVYGKAVDKETGELIYGHDGLPLELYNMFVADSDEMLLDIMQFEFDASDLAGKEIVFEEYLYADEDKTILITEEEDLGSEEETVFFLNDINLATTLLDDNGEHVTLSGSHVSLTDTVEYSGAKVGETYTVTGTLMDRDTGLAVTDVNGDVVTATSEPFVAESSDGYIEITFEFDEDDTSGDELVAYEKLYNSEGTLVAAHEDINDEDQSVSFPEIGTLLLDLETMSHQAVADENTVLVDYVGYEGLLPDTEYTLTGTLMNKATGQKLYDANGNEVTTDVTFITPSLLDAIVSEDESIDDLIDSEVESDIEASETEDIDEETTDEDTTSGKEDVLPDEEEPDTFDLGVVTTGPDMPNIVVAMWGTEFDVTVDNYEDIVDISTGLTDDGHIEYIGNEYSEYRFKAGLGTGLVGHSDTIDKLTFTFEDGTTEDYLVIIVTSEEAVDNLHWTAGRIEPEDFMDLKYSSSSLTHEDEKGTYAAFTIENAQETTLTFPELDDIEFYMGFDDVGYLKFYTPGVYTVSFKNDDGDEWIQIYIVDGGTDYDITTPEPDTDTEPGIVENPDDENPVARDQITVSGVVEVPFEFDATGLDGIYTVAFEYMYDTDGNLIASHEDMDDEGQTVKLVEVAIGTTLIDDKTGTHYAVASENATLTDEVVYDGLTVDSNYTMVGVLMDKETGEIVTDASGNDVYSYLDFTADSVSGEVYVPFNFDAAELNGDAVVAYEYLYDEYDRLIASHEDIEDEGQTLWFGGPGIGTTLLNEATGTHEVTEDGRVTLVDTVAYDGFTAGETYTVEGVLMDRATETYLLDTSGNEITGSNEFTADSTGSGTVNVVFTFDATDLDGLFAVAYEYAYDADDILVASHEDIGDEAQTVSIVPPEVVIESTNPDNPTPTYMQQQQQQTSGDDTSGDGPKTGDHFMRNVWIVILICAAGVCAVSIPLGIRRYRRNHPGGGSGGTPTGGGGFGGGDGGDRNMAKA